VARCLTTDQFIALHARAVRATGGRPEGIRDRNGLESATMRPRFLAHYADADIISQAAALATGLSRAQAFVDGI
jgi:prophage maintenance system killer protein